MERKADIFLVTPHSRAEQLAAYASSDDGRRRRRAGGLGTSTLDIRWIEAYLPRAIARRELRLHFQPQFGVDSGIGCGVEALVRWTGPRGAQVQPSVFIPVAERLGLIGSLGAWVLQQACETVANWRFASSAEPSLSVNVSSLQINREFAEVIGRILRVSGLAPDRLELEITESALITDMEYVTDCLLLWKTIGVKIAVDDFGSGYSNLNYLCRMPVDRLKLDKTFVHRMLHDRKTAAVVRSVFSLGRDIGIAVLAEGVETEEQLDALIRLGCLQVQGFLLAKPVPASEARVLLTSIWGDRWRPARPSPPHNPRELYAS